MTILMFVTALCLSAIAAFYSLVGLAAIFAAAVVPIIIMGSVLEVSKLVVASWLYRNWKPVPILLKSYLTFAVIVLMIITSMGIFGFLSKAHIEQTAMSSENMAQIQVIDEKMLRSDVKIKRWQEEIDKLLRTGSTGTGSALLEQDQVALKDLRNQIKSEKDVVRAEADKRIANAQQRRDKEIEAAKPLLEDWGGEEKYNNEVLKAKQTEQNESSVARTDRDKKLAAIDKKYSTELKTLNKRINEARSGSTSKAADADKRIKELEKNIEAEQKAVDLVREDKLVFEKEYRKLEAEVGPVKYIAELIYGETNETILEKAVRVVIIMLVSVFDPLAVLMLIAANWSWKNGRPLAPSPVRDLGPMQREVLRGPKKEPPVKKPKAEPPKEIVRQSSVDKDRAKVRASVVKKRKWLEKEEPPPAPPPITRNPSLEIFGNQTSVWKDKDNK